MGLIPLNLDVLPPTDDRIFKVLLTLPDAKPVLMDLITSIIKYPVVDVVVRNNELPVEDTEGKAERFDVNCRIKDGTQIDFEMAASRIQEDSDGKHRNLKGKSIYYLCDLHSSQSAKGVRRYDKLAKTYQVTFCSYTVFPNRKEFINSFSMRHDNDNELLSDAVCMIIVELSKLEEILKKPVNDMTDLEKWAVFFQYANATDHRETVNKVIESKEALQMAGSILMSISQDERERAVYRSRRMYETDRESDIATAEDRGARQRDFVIARKLLIRGRPIEEIIEDTGLTGEEIERLRYTD